LLVTGGAGFIGSAFVRHAVAAGYRVITLDKLGYAANLRNLDPVRDSGSHRLVKGDIGDRALVARLLVDESPAAIINFAAETHVDRSIDDPAHFVTANVDGFFHLLEAVRSWRSHPPGFRLLHVSTDEVYGPIATGLAAEDAPFCPSSPYAASKAAADCLARAYVRTYGLPIVIGRCSNNYGAYQFPEKLIPLMIVRALQERSLPLYGDGLQERDWILVDDCCRALAGVLQRGAVGREYNVGSGETRTNREVVAVICQELDRLRPRKAARPYAELIESVADRPGHDRRYALDAGRLREEIGWSPAASLADGLRSTVAWYLQNEAWWSELLASRYDGGRLGLGGASRTGQR
jgi:dTDP-glucose 4,6-dehydratase